MANVILRLETYVAFESASASAMTSVLCTFLEGGNVSDLASNTFD